MKALNKTHYFSINSKVYNKFPDTTSFNYERDIRNGYFQRLYFEHLYTKSVGGIAFFHTLTYNDNSIPSYRGRPCWSYRDIRYVTDGKLVYWLKKNYGARLRYFIACESGEGKGKRGLGNNPHYHLISFIQPFEGKSCDTSFKCPTAAEFNKKIKDLWQGEGITLYKDTLYGICKEGKNEGVIDDTNGAFSYVGKYVIKDAVDTSNIEFFKAEYRKEVESIGITEEVYRDFIDEHYDCILDGVNVSDFDEHCPIDTYHFFHNSHPDTNVLDYLTQFCGIAGVVLRHNLENWFRNVYCEMYVKVKLSEYMSNWSGKVRCSKSLGEYGLNFIEDESFNPKFTMQLGKKGYKVQRPCLYYIRKKYYYVYLCSVTGHPLYRLNQLGFDLKRNNLFSLINSVQEHIVDNIHRYYASPGSFKNIDKYTLDIITQRDDYTDILRRFAVYSVVYQYRYYNNENEHCLTPACVSTDYEWDYIHFLVNEFSVDDFQTDTVYDVIHNKGNLISFSSHPAFKPYRACFERLEHLNDVVDKYVSDQKKYQYGLKAEYVKKFNQAKYNG